MRKGEVGKSESSEGLKVGRACPVSGLENSKIEKLEDWKIFGLACLIGLDGELLEGFNDIITYLNMKNLCTIFFILLLFSCKKNTKEVEFFDLTGIWSGHEIILIQDSTMINPFWGNYGFFKYSIKKDTLIVEDPELESIGKIEFLDENHFYLIAFNQDNDTLRFEKVPKTNPLKFEYLIFEGGSVEGRLPFFKMHIDKNGLVKYEGDLYSNFKGEHEFQLGTMILNQINQLFEFVAIQNYPKDDLLLISDTEEMNLFIKYPGSEEIKIENGAFSDNYFVIQRVFNRFESLLNMKKANDFTLDSASSTVK
ncbi:DUF6438 domain-containing protein [Belliella marina]|uniref:DUF6438 domain-containing protein n=1 Tax=Belliella marina TaxID=1644146 RepID=A0ABW4VU69_9BACT